MMERFLLVVVMTAVTVSLAQADDPQKVVSNLNHDDPHPSYNGAAPRIINGYPTGRTDHPYICALIYWYIDSWWWSCATVIIEDDVVVTAAHCVKDMEDIMNSNDLFVSCGRYNITQYEDQEQARMVVNFKIHHANNETEKGGLINDVAVLKLEVPLTLNAYVNTIPIADTLTQETTGQCKLVGWGQTESEEWSPVLREAPTNFVRSKSCKWVTPSYNFLTRRHACFRGNGTSTDATACLGDSGGPAVCGGRLVGVASFGVEGCPTDMPTVYMRMRKYRRFIRRSVRRDL